jgi:hypothetical protein
MLAWLIMLVGCRNPCQNLCLDIRDFAEEECGITVPEEQVKSCLKTQRQIEREQAQSCMTAAPSLEEEWECDDVEVYFRTEASSGDADTGS